MQLDFCNPIVHKWPGDFLHSPAQYLFEYFALTLREQLLVLPNADELSDVTSRNKTEPAYNWKPCELARRTNI